MVHIVRPIAGEGQTDDAVEDVDGRHAQVDVLLGHAQGF